jgi:hypothetical protein
MFENLLEKMETPKTLVDKKAMKTACFLLCTGACVFTVLAFTFIVVAAFATLNGKPISSAIPSSLILMLLVNMMIGRASQLKETYFLYSKLNELTTSKK